jgi:hypothetical protein
MTRRVSDDERLVVDGDVECSHRAVAHSVDAVEVLLQAEALQHARRKDGADLVRDRAGVRVRGRGGVRGGEG